MTPKQPDTLDDSMLDETEIFISKAKIREAIGEDEYPRDNEQNVNWKRTPGKRARDLLRAELRQSLLGEKGE